MRQISAGRIDQLLVLDQKTNARAAHPVGIFVDE